MVIHIEYGIEAHSSLLNFRINYPEAKVTLVGYILISQDFFE